jgi:type III secretion protein X
LSDFRVGSGAFFDKGIDSITFKSGDAVQGLPDQRELTPADHGERPQLDQLLAMPNLDDFLDQATRPELQNRDLLLPGKFRQAMESTLTTLQQAVGTAQASDPDSAKVLNRAVRLLNDEMSMRDLLQMYRSVLYQG